MSNPSVYGKFFDHLVDTGNYGGDQQDAISEVHNLLDETGIKVSRDSGIVWADGEPQAHVKTPEDLILQTVRVPIYSQDAKKADNPQPIGYKERLVPVTRKNIHSSIDANQYGRKTIFENAQTVARATFLSGKKHTTQDTCPFTGANKTLYYKLHHIFKAHESIPTEKIDRLVRLIRKVVPETEGQFYDLANLIISQVSQAANPYDELDQMVERYFNLAKILHDSSSVSQAVEQQLEVIAYAAGTTPDVLIRDGLFMTNTGRWLSRSRLDAILDSEIPNELNELYADYHTEEDITQAVETDIRKEKFESHIVGSSFQRSTKIFDPKSLIRKPVDKKFQIKVNKYTVLVWPKGHIPETHNVMKFEIFGFLEDLHIEIFNKYPKVPYKRIITYLDMPDKTKIPVFEEHKGWNIKVEKDPEKHYIMSNTPVFRHAAWHLKCNNSECNTTWYRTPSGISIEEFAILYATPDHYKISIEETAGDLKARYSNIFKMPFNQYVLHLVSQEKCSCGGPISLVIPKISVFDPNIGENVAIPKMIRSVNYAWYHKPEFEDDFDKLVKKYKSRKKAAMHMHTIATRGQLKYAELCGETTYVTYELDWLMQPDQEDVRNLQGEIDSIISLDKDRYNSIKERINQLSNRKKKFLQSWLFSRYRDYNLSIIKNSEFVNAVEKRLKDCTTGDYHNLYKLITKALMTKSNDEISITEKSYIWSLLRNMRNEIQWSISKNLSDKDKEAIAYWTKIIDQASFRHMEKLNLKIAQLEKTLSESVKFSVRELLKKKYNYLSETSKSNTWIEEQQEYLMNILSNKQKLDIKRIEDIYTVNQKFNSQSGLDTLLDKVIESTEGKI